MLSVPCSENNWLCIPPHVDWTNVFAKFSGPGGFAMMDILEVGNGVLTPDEGVSHFSLWAGTCACGFV